MASTDDVDASSFYTAGVSESPPSTIVDDSTTVDADGASSTSESRSDYYSPRCEAMKQSKKEFSYQVGLEIEFSKQHWTEVSRPPPLSAEEELLNRQNREVFNQLRRDPDCSYFFEDDCEGHYVLGKRIAEGGQAEIFELAGDPDGLMKVFKSGTPLQDLQKSWLLQILNKEVRSSIVVAVMLKDGRFAFNMKRCWGDLRKLIDQAILQENDDGVQGPPFPYNLDGMVFAPEDIMWWIAQQMERLHKQGVFHRDLKASNILVNLSLIRMGFYNYPTSLVMIADFECSVGVLGTGFWRAPEILVAIEKREVVTVEQWEKADVYSYGMTCFEIVTGRIPFDGELENTKEDRALVIEGKRPRLPSDLDCRVKDLITQCWDSNPILRPTFSEIVKLVEDIRMNQCHFR